MSQILKDVVSKGGYDKVIATTSAFGKDVIPRLGGLLDVQPITDVIGIIVTSCLYTSFHRRITGTSL